MQFFLFYLAYPFIYGIALLPFSVLYKVSDVLYHVLRLTGYRQSVVLENLRNSFPDKNPDEIDAMSKAYYRYLCDLILETVKTLTMSAKEAKEHCVFHHADWLDQYSDEKRSIILVMGHYGNWEWAGPSFTLNTKFQLVVIYQPLSNPYFEKMMVRARTRFGTKIAPVSQTLRDMVSRRGTISATALIADQTAPGDKALWTTFLHQDTAVFTGPERLSNKFNYPVVYIHVKSVKRGYYELYPELLFANPKETVENEISEGFMKRLEKEILIDPTFWLWSHRRWKHKRPENPVN